MPAGVEHVLEALLPRGGALRVGRVQQDRELVRPGAGDLVDAAHRLAQDFRAGAQQSGASGRAVTLVDRAEAVEIEGGAAVREPTPTNAEAGPLVLPGFADTPDQYGTLLAGRTAQLTRAHVPAEPVVIDQESEAIIVRRNIWLPPKS